MESFAGHTLLRRLDSGGHVEFHEAEPSSGAGDRRLLIRASAHAERWPPWADPALAMILRHHNIVAMHQAAAFENPPFFVLEFIPGCDLRELLACERLTPDLACYVVRELCAGLAAALRSRAKDGTHLRWTHGQIGPRAVHLSVHGEVKVSGFGVGRLKPEDPSPAGVLDERIALLAPEQAAGSSEESPAPQTDVFLAGAVLHMMIDGPLLETDQPGELLRTLARRERGTFSRIRTGISPALSDLLGAALAARPGDRPADAADVAARLDELPELRDRGSAARQLGALVRRCVDVSGRSR